jgi:acyl CoA:acetate/3-ketoacid CoA transferase
MINKFVTAEAAAALIRDGDTVALIGGGGGLVEATCMHAAIEQRFLETGHPRGLTVIHSLGIGDRKSRGMNRFAHEGMVKRVIGGHWVWSPRMQELARQDKIEAYVLPGGVAMQLFREIGAGRPGLFTHVGLGTFVDPRVEGGRMNKAAKDDLIEVVTIDGRELLRYKPFPVNVAVIRGSFADAHGNISLDQEPANVDIYAAALAAHNSGGKVIVQVRTAVEVGALPARSVRVPGAIVDAVVVDPLQQMGYDVVYDPTMSGEIKGPPKPVEPQPFTVRQLIARRAADELREGRGAQLRLRHSGRRRAADRRARPHRPLLPDHRARHLWGRVARGHAVRLCAQRHRDDRRAVAVRFLFGRRAGYRVSRLRRDRRERQRQRLQARRRHGRPGRLHRHRAERPQGRVLR